MDVTRLLQWTHSSSQHHRHGTYMSFGILVYLQDAKIIESIRLSRTQMVDNDEWHFTTNGKYTLNLGYQVERVYPDSEEKISVYGPIVTLKRLISGKIRCPPMIKHFLWQIVSGCIPAKKNLCARGLQDDIQCARCGATEKSINHVLFECSLAVHVWVLLKILLHPNLFPSSSLFRNMDHFIRGWLHPWRIISLLGFYGTSGKDETTKFLVT